MDKRTYSARWLMALSISAIFAKVCGFTASSLSDSATTAALSSMTRTPRLANNSRRAVPEFRSDDLIAAQEFLTQRRAGDRFGHVARAEKSQLITHRVLILRHWPDAGFIGNRFVDVAPGLISVAMWSIALIRASAVPRTVPVSRPAHRSPPPPRGRW